MLYDLELPLEAPWSWFVSQQTALVNDWHPVTQCRPLDCRLSRWLRGLGLYALCTQLSEWQQGRYQRYSAHFPCWTENNNGREEPEADEQNLMGESSNYQHKEARVLEL